MSNDFFFAGGKSQRIGFFIQETRRLKVKLENCPQIYKRKNQRGEYIVLPVHCRWGPQASSDSSQRKKYFVPMQSDVKRIRWTAGCNTFCLHLLVYCGLVTVFFPLASSLAVHLKVAHILLLPLMVSKWPYLWVNSHLWSSHNDKVVLLRVLLLAKNLLLQKSKAISRLIYWTTALWVWSTRKALI